MKILVLGDPHFKLDLPYADHVSDRRKGERDGSLAFIHEQAKGCDAVVLMGDNLDKRHNHSSVIKDFVTFLEGFGDTQLYIISGNHETYEGTKTAIDFLIGQKPNWMVMTPTQILHEVNVGETRLGFVPYMTRTALEVTDDKSGADAIVKAVSESSRAANKFDVVFTHHAISGTKTLGGMTDLFNEVILPRETLEAETKLLVGGHIHQPSVVGRTIVTGSLFTQDMGETHKSIWRLDTASMDDPGDVRFLEIRLPLRPIYKAEYLIGKTEKVIAELDELEKGSIVKFISHDPSIDIEAVKEKLREFDASIVLEDYPSERTRLHVDEKQTLDMSVDSLLTLYADARKKDPERLKKAFRLLQET